MVAALLGPTWWFQTPKIPILTFAYFQMGWKKNTNQPANLEGLGTTAQPKLSPTTSSPQEPQCQCMANNIAWKKSDRSEAVGEIT